MANIAKLPDLLRRKDYSYHRVEGRWRAMGSQITLILISSSARSGTMLHSACKKSSTGPFPKPMVPFEN